MSPGPWQILIVVVLILLLFGGRGKISSIMGDMGKGITSFKKGLKDETGDIKSAADSAINVTPKKTAAPVKSAPVKRAGDKTDI